MLLVGRRTLVRGMLACAAMSATLGCEARQPNVVVRTELAEVPLADLEIVALPFNPNRILDSLAALAPEPRPQFGELEQELTAFIPPDERRYADATAPWRLLRDSVRLLGDSLRQLDRRTAHYARMYDRFRELYGRLAERTADRDRLLRELMAEDRTLAARAREAAEALRAWEAQAYAAFPAAAEAAILHAGRPGHETHTDSVGVARLSLEPGRWWVVARTPDPRNPFLEYVWNQEVTLAAWLPVAIPLTEHSAERRWRH